MMVFVRNFAARVFFNRSDFVRRNVFMLRRERLRVGKHRFYRRRSFVVGFRRGVLSLCLSSSHSLRIGVCRPICRRCFRRARTRRRESSNQTAIADKIKICFIFSPVYFYFATMLVFSSQPIPSFSNNDFKNFSLSICFGRNIFVRQNRSRITANAVRRNRDAESRFELRRAV